MGKVNNIEALRKRYRRSSVLNGLNTKQRKVILHAWRDSLSRRDRIALDRQVKILVTVFDGMGYESALEYIFKLFEFTCYVEKFKISTPSNKGVTDDFKNIFTMEG